MNTMKCTICGIVGDRTVVGSVQNEAAQWCRNCGLPPHYMEEAADGTIEWFVDDDANDNLIAAAPDLLEALHYLIQDQPGTKQFDKWWPSRVKAAREAIAKATGA